MAGGLRFRSEASLISSLGTPYALVGSPISIVPASKVSGFQRVGVYRAIFVAGSAAGTVQFQDTSGNALGMAIPLVASGSFFADTPINGDPWWQTGQGPNFTTLPIGVGLQLALTGTGFTVSADIWVAWGA